MLGVRTRSLHGKWWTAKNPLTFLKFRICPSLSRSLVALRSHYPLKFPCNIFEPEGWGTRKESRYSISTDFAGNSSVTHKGISNLQQGLFQMVFELMTPKNPTGKTPLYSLTCRKKNHRVVFFLSPNNLRKSTLNCKWVYSFGGLLRAVSNVSFLVLGLHLKPLSPTHPAGRGNLITDTKSCSSGIIWKSIRSRVRVQIWGWNLEACCRK